MVTTVEAALADAGGAVRLPDLPVADVDAALAPVTDAITGLGIPVEAPAVPTTPDADRTVADVQDAVAAVGLPADVPAEVDSILTAVDEAVAGLPADVPLDVPAVPAAPNVDGVLATVNETVAALGLPVAVPALPGAPDPASVLATVEDAVAILGVPLPGI